MRWRDESDQKLLVMEMGMRKEEKNAEMAKVSTSFFCCAWAFSQSGRIPHFMHTHTHKYTALV